VRWMNGFSRRGVSLSDVAPEVTGFSLATLPIREGIQTLLVTVHTWGNTRAWERGRPARVASPKARCPRSQEKCEHLPLLPVLRTVVPVLPVATCRTIEPRACRRRGHYALLTRDSGS
jgi:hypothetical protein